MWILQRLKNKQRERVTKQQQYQTCISASQPYKNHFGRCKLLETLSNRISMHIRTSPTRSSPLHSPKMSNQLCQKRTKHAIRWTHTQDHQNQQTTQAMIYHTLCTKCGRKRKCEAPTLGDCLAAMKQDGWTMMGNTKLACGECNKGDGRVGTNAHSNN